MNKEEETKVEEDGKQEVSHLSNKVEQEKKEEVKEEKVEIKSAEKIKKGKDIEAVINIYTSFNNTLVHVTDMSGRTLAKVTGGQVTKQGRLKANPTVAMFISKRISETMKDLGITELYVKIRAKTRNPAPGPGANAIIKSLSREGFKIINILDTTRFPRGGPKKKGGRRGRRP
ncbi:MAG: 30S ribosomal protein S11 [Nanoarchaeota archaeon]|nr:30S ribosomal protein S11 [Nanoarchaeota archaeon]